MNTSLSTVVLPELDHELKVEFQELRNALQPDVELSGTVLEDALQPDGELSAAVLEQLLLSLEDPTTRPEAFEHAHGQQNYSGGLNLSNAVRIVRRLAGLDRKLRPINDELKVREEHPQPDRGQNSLLFIHGTLSSCKEAFSDSFMDHFKGTYNNILAFDHDTATRTPQKNAQNLLEQLERFFRDSRKHQIDVIAHSRGGWVGSQLSGLKEALPGITLRSAVYAGCPFRGTPMANVPKFIRVALGAGALRGNLLSALLHAGLRTPGIDPLHKDSGTSTLADTGFERALTLGSNYEPTAKDAKDVLADSFMGLENDLVVPTHGCSLSKASSELVAQSVHHFGYFSNAGTTTNIYDFLAPDAP